MEITVIDPSKVEIARGQLIVKLGRDITWGEFAEICDLSGHTISNLKSGRTGGSPITLRKLVLALRAHGVPVVEEDFLTPASLVSSPAT